MNPERREEPDEQTDIDRRFADIIWNIDPSFTIPDTPAPVERSKKTRADDLANEALEGTDNSEDAEDSADGPAADEAPDGAPPGSAAPLAALPDQWRMPPTGSASLLDDDEADAFVPAPPQPLPSGEDLGFWTMIGCLIGGPAWLLYLFFFDRYAQSLWWVLACALFVAGVVQLIMRSPKNRDDLDDDDGAVL